MMVAPEQQMQMVRQDVGENFHVNMVFFGIFVVLLTCIIKVKIQKVFLDKVASQNISLLFRL